MFSKFKTLGKSLQKVGKSVEGGLEKATRDVKKGITGKHGGTERRDNATPPAEGKSKRSKSEETPPANDTRQSAPSTPPEEVVALSLSATPLPSPPGCALAEDSPVPEHSAAKTPLRENTPEKMLATPLVHSPSPPASPAAASIVFSEDMELPAVESSATAVHDSAGQIHFDVVKTSPPAEVGPPPLTPVKMGQDEGSSLHNHQNVDEDNDGNDRALSEKPKRSSSSQRKRKDSPQAAPEASSNRNETAATAAPSRKRLSALPPREASTRNAQRARSKTPEKSAQRDAASPESRPTHFSRSSATRAMPTESKKKPSHVTTVATTHDGDAVSSGEYEDRDAASVSSAHLNSSRRASPQAGARARSRHANADSSVGRPSRKGSERRRIRYRSRPVHGNGSEEGSGSDNSATSHKWYDKQDSRWERHYKRRHGGGVDLDDRLPPSTSPHGKQRSHDGAAPLAEHVDAAELIRECRQDAERSWAGWSDHNGYQPRSNSNHRQQHRSSVPRRSRSGSHSIESPQRRPVSQARESRDRQRHEAHYSEGKLLHDGVNLSSQHLSRLSFYDDDDGYGEIRRSGSQPDYHHHRDTRSSESSSVSNEQRRRRRQYRSPSQLHRRDSGISPTRRSREEYNTDDLLHTSSFVMKRKVDEEREREASPLRSRYGRHREHPDYYYSRTPNSPARRRMVETSPASSRVSSLRNSRRASSSRGEAGKASPQRRAASVSRSVEPLLDEVEWKIEVLSAEIAEEDATREEAMLSSPFERLYYLNNRRSRDERRKKIFQLNRLERIRDRLQSGSFEDELVRKAERLRKQEEMLTSPNGVFVRLYQNSPQRSARSASRGASRDATPTKQPCTSSANGTVLAGGTPSRASTTRSRLSRAAAQEVSDRLYKDAAVERQRREDLYQEAVSERRQAEVDELLIGRLVAQIQRGHSRDAPSLRRRILSDAELEAAARRELGKMRETDPGGYERRVLRGTRLSQEEQKQQAGRLYIHGFVPKDRLESKKKEMELKECTFHPQINSSPLFGAGRTPRRLRSDARGERATSYVASSSSGISDKTDEKEAVMARQRRSSGRSGTPLRQVDPCQRLYDKGVRAKERSHELREERDKAEKLKILRSRMENDHHFKRRVELDPSLAQRFMNSLVV